MAKNKRKPPAAAVKRTQSLHAPVPSHTNQGGSPVPSCISAPGHGTNTAREVDGSPVDNSNIDGSMVDNSTANGSPVDNSNIDGSPVDNSTANGSPVDNTTASLDMVLEEGYSEDEVLGEEHLDFSCSEEDYPPSSPVPVVSDLVVPSTPVVPAPPARPKGATFTPSSSTQLRSSNNVTLPNGNPLIQRVIYETLPKFCKLCKVLGHSTGACSKGKAEVRSVKKVDAASVTSKGNVNDKGSVFTRLTPVADSLGDDTPAVAPPVESPHIATPPVDAPELDAPSNPSASSVAPDVQPCPQVKPASVEEWQPVRNRRNNAGNKRQTQTPSPTNGNPAPQNHVSSKGKAPALSVDITANKAPFCSTSS
ncbi:hypothetical protein OIU84_017502, partial [Salix udensis]